MFQNLSKNYSSGNTMEYNPQGVESTIYLNIRFSTNSTIKNFFLEMFNGNTSTIIIRMFP